MGNLFEIAKKMGFGGSGISTIQERLETIKNTKIQESENYKESLVVGIQTSVENIDQTLKYIEDIKLNLPSKIKTLFQEKTTSGLSFIFNEERTELRFSSGIGSLFLLIGIGGLFTGGIFIMQLLITLEFTKYLEWNDLTQYLIGAGIFGVISFFTSIIVIIKDEESIAKKRKQKNTNTSLDNKMPYRMYLFYFTAIVFGVIFFLFILEEFGANLSNDIYYFLFSLICIPTFIALIIGIEIIRYHLILRNIKNDNLFSKKYRELQIDLNDSKKNLNGFIENVKSFDLNVNIEANNQYNNDRNTIMEGYQTGIELRTKKEKIFNK